MGLCKFEQHLAFFIDGFALVGTLFKHEFASLTFSLFLTQYAEQVGLKLQRSYVSGERRTNLIYTWLLPCDL